jgi:RNA polymerase sigma-70 factor (ECF subfamily)
VTVTFTRGVFWQMRAGLAISASHRAVDIEIPHRTLAGLGDFASYPAVSLDTPLEKEKKDAAFVTTRWTMVMAAGRQKAPGSQEAIRWLCEQYWFPIYAYARRHGKNPHEAEDLAQGFFEELLTKNTVVHANENRGSFRTFLLMSFDQFIRNLWNREHRAKRGGEAVFIALHEAEAEARFLNQFTDPSTPEHAFDRAWILSVIERVMKVLQSECDADGKTGHFHVLKDFLEAERADTTYAEAARNIHITVPALRMLIYRLRQRFREMMTHEIRQTVVLDSEVRPELDHLLKVLR